MAPFTPAQSQRTGLVLFARHQATLMWGADLQLVHTASLSLQDAPCCCTQVRHKPLGMQGLYSHAAT